MALPRPVWSNDVISRHPSSLNWNTWKNDPTKLAVLRAISSCDARLGRDRNFGCDIVDALAQQYVRFFCVFLCFLCFGVLGVLFGGTFH